MTPLLVDCSVLIDLSRDRDAGERDRVLTRPLANREVVIGDLVMMEVLQGFREPRAEATRGDVDG